MSGAAEELCSWWGRGDSNSKAGLSGYCAVFLKYLRGYLEREGTQMAKKSVKGSKRSKPPKKKTQRAPRTPPHKPRTPAE